MQSFGTNMIFDFIDVNVGRDNKIPEIQIDLNGRICYAGSVQRQITIPVALAAVNLLRIYFVNKTSADTQSNERGEIINDMNFTLANVTAENVTFDELLWNGRYIAGDTVYESCLFFGPGGFYQLEFESPILKHKLQQKFERGELDAHWEEDYNYYTDACEILNKLSIR